MIIKMKIRNDNNVILLKMSPLLSAEPFSAASWMITGVAAVQISGLAAKTMETVFRKYLGVEIVRVDK